jgi:NADH-quinone oxidoreductase subunit L
MVVPMLVLAIVTVFAGFSNIDNGLEHLLVGALPDEGPVDDTKFRLGIALGSTAMALGGIGLAYVIYGAKLIPSAVFSRVFRPVQVLLENKYYADVLYEQVIVGFLFYRVIGGALSAFDRVVVDGAVNGIGRGARQSASVVRYVQNGQFQTYGALAFSGVVFTAIVVLVLSPL